MMCAVPDFFENPVMGINCASGFITFDADGQPSQRPHAPNDRARHTLPGCWAAGMSGGVPSGSLLDRLLTGSFAGDEDAADKINLLAEIAGVSALGYATELREPKAVILYGMTAENGKSQILDLMRGLLPPSAVSAITAAKMSDERYVVGLAGKLLNATDELSGAAIASDTFKTIITGEQVNGRDVYKSCIEFCPHAQHMFATNVLPPYKGGMDRGVQRRLLVVPFNHTVPKAERVEHIGKRIGAEEADLLLAWAVAGASRVIRNRAFSEPQSSKSALREWVCKADAVQAWIEIGIEAAPGHWVATSVAYEAFCNWAVSEGYMRDRLPNVSSFSERLQSTVAGVTDKRTSRKRGLVGLRIKPLF
jgi:P4 family phage/plasmid primase-like protien